MSKEAIRKEWKVKRISPKLLKTILSCLEGEIKTYAQWSEGQVYGYTVTDPNGNEIDACWGFYDEPEAIAKEQLASYKAPNSVSFIKDAAEVVP